VSKCRHFIGIQHKNCKAGVEMASVRDVSQPGMARWPCLTLDANKAATTVCPKRELMTAEDLAERRKNLLEAVVTFAQALHEGKCPECGAPIEPKKIEGRCVYASCGHRLGQIESAAHEEGES